MINRIENWKMKIWKQIKTEKNGRPIVVMTATLNGAKKEDGTYAKGVDAYIMVDETTNWLPSDYTGLMITVSGQIKPDGKLYIKASILNEYIYEKAKDTYSKPNSNTEHTATNTKTADESEWQAVSDDLLSEIPFC